MNYLYPYCNESISYILIAQTDVLLVVFLPISSIHPVERLILAEVSQNDNHKNRSEWYYSKNSQIKFGYGALLLGLCLCSQCFHSYSFES